MKTTVVPFSQLPLKRAPVLRKVEHKTTKNMPEIPLAKIETLKYLENESSEFLCNKIDSALEIIDLSYLEIAASIYLLHKRQYHKEIGYRSFHTYIRERFDFSVQKAYGLKNIYEKLVELSLPADRLETIGWSKMQYITPLINHKNKEEWLNVCESKTSHEVQEITRRIKETEKQRKEKGIYSSEDPEVIASYAENVRYFSIYMSENQRSVLQEALDRIRQYELLNTDLEALEFLSLNYLKMTPRPKLTSIFEYYGFNEILDMVCNKCPENVLIEISYLDEGFSYDDLEKEGELE